MANPTCSVSSLRKNCFQGTVLDPLRRKALLVYLMAAELKGIGGTDYTSALISGQSGGLIGDAVAGLQQATRDQIGESKIGLYELGLQLNNAVAAGEVADSSINVLMDNIKCLLNVNEITLDMLIVWLKCNLGVHKDYVQ